MSAVYTQYTVQEGDRLWRLWKQTHMTEAEWLQVNPGRDPNRIFAGEEIVIKDPIATCLARDEYRSEQTTMFELSGGRNLDVCEDRVAYAPFKPLRAFTKSLEKE